MPIGMSMYVPDSEYQETLSLIKRHGLVIEYDREGIGEKREVKVYGEVEQINAYNRDFETEIYSKRPPEPWTWAWVWQGIKLKFFTFGLKNQ